MGIIFQVICSCKSKNKKQEEIYIPEISSSSMKYVKTTFYQGIGFRDIDVKRSSEIYPCYNCGNLTVSNQIKPKCSNPNCRRRVYKFDNKGKKLKCPFCKKYEMELEEVGLWD